MEIRLHIYFVICDIHTIYIGCNYQVIDELRVNIIISKIQLRINSSDNCLDLFIRVNLNRHHTTVWTKFSKFVSKSYDGVNMH